MNMLRQAWDRLSLYLPVALMGVLALGTWWLVRNAPSPVGSDEPAVASTQPDYFMQGFSVKSFDANGRLQNEVQGQMARHFPQTDSLEIDAPRMQSVGPDGQITVATADKGVTNTAGTEIRLFGNAVVVREPAPGRSKQQDRMEFRSEYLHAWTQTQRVRSDRPVEILRGTDRLTADRLDYDHMTQVLELEGRVKGVLNTRP
jgi:lipopolysaccharide export system protein LptC